MNFPLLPSVFLLCSLGVPICVVYVEIILDMGVGIHGKYWGNTLAWIDQRFLVYRSSGLV